MGFEFFFSKYQLSPNDYDLLLFSKDFQGAYTQFKELERMNDPTYLSRARSIIAINFKLEKRLEEIITASCASFLGPLRVYESYSPRSSSSRSLLSSSIGSNDLFR